MKKGVLWALLCSVFVIVFNAAFFILGDGERSAVAWLSYGGIHLTYAATVATMIGSGAMKTRSAFALSLSAVTVAFFVLNFGVNLLFLLLDISSLFNVALIVQLVMFGVWAVLVIPQWIVHTNAEKQREQQHQTAMLLKDCASRVSQLAKQESDGVLSAALERLCDLLQSSPVASAESVAYIEAEIYQNIAVLDNAMRCQNTAEVTAVLERTVALVNERNRQLQLGNR